MKMHAVESSNLAAIGWQTDGTLTVRFRSGQTYIYAGVPRSVYRGLLHAESKGQYFHQHVRNTYEFARLEQE